MLFPIFQNLNSAIILACSFIAGAGLAAAIGAYAKRIGEVLGVIDEPSASDGHKQHYVPTPAVGGVIALVVAATVLLLTIPWSDPGNLPAKNARLWGALAICLVMIIGFCDDRRHISAAKRLAADIVVFSVLLWVIPALRFTHVSFESLGLHLDLGKVGFPIALVCLVGLKNAVNMADGRNGLVLGLGIVWNVFFLFHAPAHTLPILAGISGIFIVLFILNAQGHLFLGDCGSYGIGSFFGILALALHNGPAGGMRSAEGVLLFLIPAIDTLRLMVSRLAAGRSPLSPDRRHLHHLLDAVFGWKIGWTIYMIAVAGPIIHYQIMPSRGYQIILFVLISYSALVQFLEKWPKRSVRLNAPVSKNQVENSRTV
ncbi:hypothetical protein IP81_19515 [Novosphingobium sp. AAP83]|uniref:MraY family glycosyltransferase n=1 Tax=Novosphingobium sp. AAP83 TaxID=1523425 RepID=UPI0006B904F3|nr:MraY family glycosyltransferase [Novosphingobium sp. AAP83]KPF85315.1 hypothetical protein IP81_19515 [Novosphingobium sp. AAP83]